MAGYHKAMCETCQAETWHYTSTQGETICAVHSNNILTKGPANREVKSQPSRIANRLDRSLWRNAERHTSQVDITDQAWAFGLFPETSDKVKDPSKNYCSFCDAEIDKVHTTMEKRPVIRRVMDAHKRSDGEVEITEKVVTKAETVYACPTCCLEIRKPIVVRSV